MQARALSIVWAPASCFPWAADASFGPMSLVLAAVKAAGSSAGPAPCPGPLVRCERRRANANSRCVHIATRVHRCTCARRCESWHAAVARGVPVNLYRKAPLRKPTPPWHACSLAGQVRCRPSDQRGGLPRLGALRRRSAALRQRNNRRAASLTPVKRARSVLSRAATLTPVTRLPWSPRRDHRRRPCVRSTLSQPAALRNLTFQRSPMPRWLASRHGRLADLQSITHLHSSCPRQLRSTATDPHTTVPS